MVLQWCLKGLKGQTIFENLKSAILIISKCLQPLQQASPWNIICFVFVIGNTSVRFKWAFKFLQFIKWNCNFWSLTFNEVVCFNKWIQFCGHAHKYSVHEFRKFEVEWCSYVKFWKLLCNLHDVSILIKFVFSYLSQWKDSRYT